MNKKLLTALCVAGLVMVGGASSFAADPTPKNVQASKDAIQMADAKKIIKGSYSKYDPSKIANAEHGTVILNFSASWCGTCVRADKNFKASTPPDGLTLLKVDYDTSTKLKRKYGVTIQHTFVQVDKNGKLLKKWNGSNSYDELLKNKV